MSVATPLTGNASSRSWDGSAPTSSTSTAEIAVTSAEVVDGEAAGPKLVTTPAAVSSLGCR